MNALTVLASGRTSVFVAHRLVCPGLTPCLTAASQPGSSAIVTTDVIACTTTSSTIHSIKLDYEQLCMLQPAEPLSSNKCI